MCFCSVHYCVVQRNMIRSHNEVLNIAQRSLAPDMTLWAPGKLTRYLLIPNKLSQKSCIFMLQTFLGPVSICVVGPRPCQRLVCRLDTPRKWEAIWWCQWNSRRTGPHSQSRWDSRCFLMETFWDYVSYEMIIMLLLNCMHDVRMIEFMSGVCTGLAGSGDCQSTAHSFIVYKSIRMNLVT